MSDSTEPDYSSEEAEAPSEGKVEQLKRLVSEMAKLSLRKMECEEELKSINERLKIYEEDLVPNVMAELDSRVYETRSGLRVELKEDVFGSFPTENAEKREQAFGYLKKTGNDGLIKQEISISFGRDTAAMQARVMQFLEEAGVGQIAEVSNQKTIHHQTMLAFIRKELKAGRPVPMDAFGVFPKKFAKIKRKGDK